MAEAAASQPAEGIVVATEFVRHRNVLLARARLTGLFLDYYLQLADTGRQVEPATDRVFKEMLAAFVLYAAARPRNEYIAWTINLQEPLLNLFATADNAAGTLIGRPFTENVKRGTTNLFYVETVRGQSPKRRSVIEFTGADIFAAVEKYFDQSEQRPGRLCDLGDEEYALLAAHPDCDLAWLRGVNPAELRAALTTETVVPLEQRVARWHCGCSERRLFEILAPAMQQDADDLFRGEDALRAECPRCGKPYRISREALEAFVASRPS